VTPKPISQSHLTAGLAVGARVVIRLRLPETEVPEGGPRHTDVVGHVRSLDETAVVVDTRSGEVTVPRDRIVLAKRVPPAPVRKHRTAPAPSPPISGAGAASSAIGIDELQVLMTAGMPPLDSQHVGEWLLRSAEGYTGRANSALAVGDPGMPPAEAVDRVAAWYAEHGQPALIQLPHRPGENPAASALGSLLVTRDWRFVTRTLVMTKPASPAVSTERVPIDISDTPSDDWWLSASPRSLEHRDTLARVLARIPEAAYLTAYVDGTAVGHARLAFTGRWSGVFDLHTDPSVRRRGVARALMAGASQLAVDQRIPLQYLQVAAENEAAVRLYRSLGWQVHHEYHYATADSGARSLTLRCTADG
jgi:ribosomal protein S18 acetylase RimI-like enzyme